MKLHDSRQLGPLVFRDPLLLCSALYFLLYFDASGFLRLGLLAAFLHECGHILVYCVFLRRFPVIEVTMTGFCMRMDAPANPGSAFPASRRNCRNIRRFPVLRRAPAWQGTVPL